MRASQDPPSDEERTSKEKCPLELLPLIVGVTGHRDYDRRFDKELTEAVAGLLKRLQETYRNTPLILLSPLAPGADRLVADVALEKQIPLYVPLPFPRDDLPPGFVADNERLQFERLCRLAERVFFIDHHPTAGGRPEPDAPYAAAGAFVAAHCHILIALWDGEGKSQTARTLGYKRAGLPQEFAPEHSLLDKVDGGLWHHVYTPRQDAALSRTKPGALVSHALSEEQVGHALCRSIDEYNRYVQDLLRRDNAGMLLEASRETLIQADDALDLSPALERLRDAFAAADVLAIALKQQAHQHFFFLAVLVVAATLVFLVQAECPFFGAQERPWLLLVAAFLLLSVQTLRGLWGRARCQDRFQDYRALAEGLRVQFYWTLLGLPDSVADHYLRKQRSELEWIRRVFSPRNIFPGGGEEAQRGLTPAQRAFRVSLVRNRWVEEQQQFFTHKHHQNETGSHRSEVSEKRLLYGYIGLMIAVGLFLLSLQGFPSSAAGLETFLSPLPARVGMPWSRPYEILHGPCILLIELPLIIAGVLHLRAEKFALTAQAKQYERMYRLFSDASRHLAQFLAGDFPQGLKSDVQVDDLIRSLGCEALSENADWVLMHRERQLEISTLS